jgi:hypothetical protein
MQSRLWLFALLFALLLSPFALVAASTGAIDSINHYAWDDNGGYVNWAATGGNVTVTDTWGNTSTSTRTVIITATSTLQ